MIIAVLLHVRQVVFDEFRKKPVLGDSIRDAEGQPAIQIVGVERFKLGDESWEFVRPQGDTLDLADQAVVARRLERFAATMAHPTVNAADNTFGINRTILVE